MIALLVTAVYLAVGVFEALHLDRVAQQAPGGYGPRVLRFVFFALLWLPLHLATDAYKFYESLRG